MDEHSERWTIEEFDPELDQDPPPDHHHQSDEDPPDLEANDG